MIRHRVISGVMWAEIPLLVLLGIFGPMSLVEGLLLPFAIMFFGAGSAMARSTGTKADLTSVGLIFGPFIAIELSGGQLSVHLYILSAVALVALYQRWSPLLLTVGAVVVHHLAFGLLAPARVMTMAGPGGSASTPTLGQVVGMVLIHASAVILEVVAILLWWHFAEVSERESIALREQLDADRTAAEQSGSQAAARDAVAEHERAQEATRRGETIVREAIRIRERAQDAVAAVTALEEQSAMLGTAVHEIAQRCQQTAARAKQGQATTEAAGSDVRRLEQAMNEIAEVNAMISQLAAQTNLLSLNATIEAARAGEMGKGFGVVAQEVKALANATASAAEKVRAVVDGVVEETEKVAQSFRSTTELVGQIGGAQTDIAASAEEQASVLAEVSRQTTAAAAAGREVTTALDQMIDSAAS